MKQFAIRVRDESLIFRFREQMSRRNLLNHTNMHMEDYLKLLLDMDDQEIRRYEAVRRHENR